MFYVIYYQIHFCFAKFSFTFFVTLPQVMIMQIDIRVFVEMNLCGVNYALASEI
jgi:hypothetical protein